MRDPASLLIARELKDREPFQPRNRFIKNVREGKSLLAERLNARYHVGAIPLQENQALADFPRVRFCELFVKSRWLGCRREDAQYLAAVLMRASEENGALVDVQLAEAVLNEHSVELNGTNWVSLSVPLHFHYCDT